jgi:hypothetical protein
VVAPSRELQGLDLPRHARHSNTVLNNPKLMLTYCRPQLVSLLLLLTLGGCSKAPTGPQEAGGAEYTYGTLLLFRKSGNAATAMSSGWSAPEDEFTWSEGKRAVVALHVPAGDESVSLRMRMSGMIKEPEFPAQPVEVLLNERKIANWNVGNTAEFTTAIPKELTKYGGTLTFTFNIPKAASPKDLGKSEDPRVLGIRVYDLTLSKS